MSDINRDTFASTGAASGEIAALAERYENDAIFRAVVDSLPSGFADDDGVRHSGPTVATARQAERILAALGLEQVGVLCPHSGGVLRRTCCALSEPVYRSALFAREADRG